MQAVPSVAHPDPQRHSAPDQVQPTDTDGLQVKRVIGPSRRVLRGRFGGAEGTGPRTVPADHDYMVREPYLGEPKERERERIFKYIYYLLISIVLTEILLILRHPHHVRSFKRHLRPSLAASHGPPPAPRRSVERLHLRNDCIASSVRGPFVPCITIYIYIYNI